MLLIVAIVLVIALCLLSVAYTVTICVPNRCCAMVGHFFFCWRIRLPGTWFCVRHQDYLSDPEDEPAATTKPWVPDTRVIFFSSDDINAPFFNSVPNHLTKLKCHVIRDDDYQRLLKERR
jgi:hypothetical protein